MRVLVTGATGYLGYHVAAQLQVAGHTVVALVREGRGHLLPAGCQPARGDLLDSGSIRRALAGCDALVHLAALVRMWARDPRDFDRVNVEALAATLRAAEEAGVKRVVYTSTIVALGPTDGEVRDERFERTEFRFRTDYERTKWLAERLVREKAAAGNPLITVYPGIVYGPGASTEANLLGGMLRRHLSGRLPARLGLGHLRICYAYTEDVARGHLLALERGTPGRGYILGGENASQDQLFSLLTELTGVPPPRYAIPYWAGEAAGRMLRAVAWLTGVPPAMTDGVVGTYRHEWAYGSARAERELGYRVTPLREGLRATVEALRRETARTGSTS
ncbi:MAG TPA: NAD-dependent epimerase/dehydratase family protein [Candidatus Polarisedimenticolia bacterium]|nr:NAD-dependent epimerase/dehydratase family protein [Candidatus Polarisedimenticolia bacterium]